MPFGIPSRIKQLWNRYATRRHTRCPLHHPWRGETFVERALLRTSKASRRRRVPTVGSWFALEGLEDRRTMDGYSLGFTFIDPSSSAHTADLVANSFGSSFFDSTNGVAQGTKPPAAEPAALVAQDTSFGDGGIVKLPFDAPVTQLDVVGGVLLPNDELAVAGTAELNTGVSQVAVAEFLSGGTLKPTFDGDGRLLDTLNATDVIAGGIGVQTGGKPIVAGATADGQTLSVIRLNTDGTRDLSFGDSDGTPDGRSALQAPANTQLLPVDVSVHPTTGVITVPIRIRNVSSNTYDFGIARWDANGTLLTSLGTDGLVTQNLGDIEDWAFSSVTATDGSTVIVGESERHAVLVRYLGNGSLDTNFGTQGVARLNFGGDIDSLQDVLIDSQNRIVVVGYATQASLPQFAVARLSSSGQLDNSFGTDGRVLIEFDTFADATTGIAEAVIELPDGRLVVAGTITGDEVGATLPGDWGVAVLTTGGQFDTSFAPNGRAVIDLGTEDRVADLIQQSGGRVVIVGSSDGQLAMTRLVFEITNPYDLNLDGFVDSRDIDRLYLAIRNGETNSRFDLNDNSSIDQTDVDFLVETVFNTVYGDANLDGIFNSTDLVLVFQTGEYEDELAGNSEWLTGDWNGDGEFNSSDFVFVFQRGGYSTAAMPELKRKPIGG